MAKPKVKDEKVKNENSNTGQEISQEEEKTEDSSADENFSEFEFQNTPSPSRDSPLIEPENRENLENILSEALAASKKEDKKEDEGKGSIDYSFNPKYSFSEEKEESHASMGSLKQINLGIQRAPEARELRRTRMEDTMLHHADEDSGMKYAPLHKDTALRESDEIKGKKLNSSKYTRNR